MDAEGIWQGQERRSLIVLDLWALNLLHPLNLSSRIIVLPHIIHKT